MLLPFSLLFLVNTLVALIFAQQQVAQDYQVQCYRYPSMAVDNKTFNPDAITALSAAIGDNSLSPKLPSDGIKLRPGYSTRVGWAGSGGYQICVQNFWFFKTLTVPLDELSAAVAAIGETCCDDATNEGKSKVPGTGGRSGRCQDAKAYVKATDGSEIAVVAQDYGQNCCGMWGC